MPRSRDGWGWTRQRLKMMMILAVQDRAHILIPLNLATLHNIKLLVNESSSRNRAAVRCGHSPEAFQAITTNLARRAPFCAEKEDEQAFCGGGEKRLHENAWRLEKVSSASFGWFAPLQNKILCVSRGLLQPPLPRRCTRSELKKTMVQ